MTEMSIGKVAKQAELQPSAIRYYESVGLLPEPPRRDGQRRYTANVLTDLAVIRMAQALSFTVADIRDLFHGFPDDVSSASRWHALAQRKVSELDAEIARAQHMRTVLAGSTSCECSTFAECSLIA